ncbi:MAG: molybdate ABC transporter substrate-binding protein [SAR324 cluster bacterium]|nr:molybdate ABC transporter substrate-binding protein [SAR324 cluster bacterium]
MAKCWMNFSKQKICIFLISVCLASPLKAESLVIYAASSTINVVQEVSKIFQQQHSVKIRTSFASSGTLAKQIALGAPAQVFLSANPLWMDYLEDKNMLIPGSKLNLLSNRLVIVAPKDQGFLVQWSQEFDLSKAFQGKFSIGHPDYVPAGFYAKEALTYFNWWSPLQTRIVAAQDVRAALIFVERNEVEMGIVYESDAMISKHVKILGRFPEKSHSPIVYPIALISAGEKLSPMASQYLLFLQSLQALEIYRKNKFGFVQK